MFQPQTSIRALVEEHPESAAVLQRHGIDLCRDSARTVAACCEARAADLVDVAREVELAAVRRRATPIDPETATTRALITRVIARHHQYLYRHLPFLRVLAARVAAEHEAREPRLLELARLVARMGVVIFDHLQDEERHLFRDILSDPASPNVAAALARMDVEHAEVEAMLRDLRRLTDGFAAPPVACIGYHTLVRELAVLEADTRRHLHIENDILRRRCIAPGRPDVDTATRTEHERAGVLTAR